MQTTHQVPPPIHNEGFIAALERIGVKTSFEPLVRLHHGHGQTCQEVRAAILSYAAGGRAVFRRCIACRLVYPSVCVCAGVREGLENAACGWALFMSHTPSRAQGVLRVGESHPML